MSIRNFFLAFAATAAIIVIFIVSPTDPYYNFWDTKPGPPKYWERTTPDGKREVYKAPPGEQRPRWQPAD